MGGTDGQCRLWNEDCRVKVRAAPEPVPDNPQSAIRNLQSEDFVLTIRPQPRGRDGYGRSPLYRLKGVLKVMLRRFGWRCVSLRPKWLEEEMEKSRQ